MPTYSLRPANCFTIFFFFVYYMSPNLLNLVAEVHVYNVVTPTIASYELKNKTDVDLYMYSNVVTMLGRGTG